MAAAGEDVAPYMRIIVPTLGNRPSLDATLHSLGPQMSEDDEVVVMVDQPLDNPLEDLMDEVDDLYDGMWFAYGLTNGPHGDYGHSPRNIALNSANALGRYHWSLDDDDIALPGSLDAIRLAINENQGRWMIFNMIGGTNSTFPDRVIPCAGPEIRVGNVGTPCIVWPASAKSRWGTGILEGEFDQRPGYLGDFTFARDLQEELGDPVWIDHVVACIRP